MIPQLQSSGMVMSFPILLLTRIFICLYGGVVPELASRAHQANIVPVTHQALLKAGIKAEDIDAVAFTRGPGLLGSLLVGTSFAKGFALAQNIPLIEVNHLQAHVLAHFILEKDKNNRLPSFPFLMPACFRGSYTDYYYEKPARDGGYREYN